MSDEQRRNEEAEVEGHLKKFHASDEPQDEVEAHLKKFHANDEQGDDDDFEGHLLKYN